ncbi:putative acyl--CoA ligase YdaB [Physella acuta]|uniref:putative acyl--CoA ligase YdaB n=1 Tax=Physella acuta TaxID=109671 RepID=UPI0027DE108A|nr:putative acyl--CoA ligase YdaB [Physella acuta]
MLSLADHLVVSYGSTETGVITWGHLNEKNNTSYKVGKPVVDAVQIRIINDNGDSCLPGEVGTVQILSPLTFRGYLNRLESPDPQTMKVLRPDGWYSTEDNGYFGQDGDLYILGRKNDVIQYGVFLLYPGWLEEKIVAHPEIAEACVVPVSDPLLFHNICACVSLTEGSELTEEEIRTYCKNIFLKNVNQALTPVPAYFLILPEGIPRNSNGKPNVQKLKAMAEEKFGCTARHAM